jgi:hypothetical protein
MIFNKDLNDGNCCLYRIAVNPALFPTGVNA